ncbi:MAG: hypothetical protein AB7E60_08990 [Sphingobium sp.]
MIRPADGGVRHVVDRLADQDAIGDHAAGPRLHQPGFDAMRRMGGVLSGENIPADGRVPICAARGGLEPAFAGASGTLVEQVGSAMATGNSLYTPAQDEAMTRQAAVRAVAPFFPAFIRRGRIAHG